MPVLAPPPMQISAESPPTHARITDAERSVRIDLLTEMIAAKQSTESMKRSFMRLYKATPQQFHATFRAAQEELIKRLSRPRETHRSESLATLEAIIRDKGTKPAERIKAQTAINSLLALDDRTFTGGDNVIPTVEVIIRSHDEFLDFSSYQKIMQEQSQAPISQPLLIEENSEPLAIDWD